MWNPSPLIVSLIVSCIMLSGNLDLASNANQLAVSFPCLYRFLVIPSLGSQLRATVVS